MNPGKMVPGKIIPGKMIPGKNGPRKNGPQEKWSPEEWPPGKMVPGKLRNEQSSGGRRASWCVSEMFGCDQSMKTQNSTTNTKLGNKAKTGNQKSWGER